MLRLGILQFKAYYNNKKTKIPKLFETFAKVIFTVCKILFNVTLSDVMGII